MTPLWKTTHVETGILALILYNEMYLEVAGRAMIGVANGKNGVFRARIHDRDF